jgi:Ca2+-binding RTX toxin-like protein
MAKYEIFGPGMNLFDATVDGGKTCLALRLLYVSQTEFGFTNADGSTTYVCGTGFKFDSKTGHFVSGKIDSIGHYTSGGKYIDSIEGLNGCLTAADFQAAVDTPGNGAALALASLLLAGDDRLSGAYFKSAPEWGVALNGFDGNDHITGSIGDDGLWGARGNDSIFGCSGDDSIYAGAGGDSVDGGTGNDVICGGGGDDVINGGAAGDDVLKGGSGCDSFVFTSVRNGPGSSEWSCDIIKDFKIGTDCLVLTYPGKLPLSYHNDAHGNAVISLGHGQSITLIGVDARHTCLDDLIC